MKHVLLFLYLIVGITIIIVNILPDIPNETKISQLTTIYFQSTLALIVGWYLFISRRDLNKNEESEKRKNLIRSVYMMLYLLINRYFHFEARKKEKVECGKYRFVPTEIPDFFASLEKYEIPLRVLECRDRELSEFYFDLLGRLDALQHEIKFQGFDTSEPGSAEEQDEYYHKTHLVMPMALHVYKIFEKLYEIVSLKKSLGSPASTVDTLPQHPAGRN